MRRRLVSAASQTPGGATILDEPFRLARATAFCSSSPRLSVSAVKCYGWTRRRNRYGCLGESAGKVSEPFVPVVRIHSE